MQSEVEFVRSLPLTGCGNFRDLGGYRTVDGRRTRWRTLFRSDSLHQMTSEDVACLETHGITISTAFDLRTPRELEALGAGPLVELGTRHAHVPFVPVVGDATNAEEFYRGLTLAQLYERMFTQAGSCIAAFFETLARTDSYPTVFFCAAGKDRTGMLAAVLLRALGVEEEELVSDYVLTETLTLARLQARRRESNSRVPEDFIMARPETIRGFLAGIDAAYASIDGYLESCGLRRATVEAVRENLLEPA